MNRSTALHRELVTSATFKVDRISFQLIVKLKCSQKNNFLKEGSVIKIFTPNKSLTKLALGPVFKCCLFPVILCEIRFWKLIHICCAVQEISNQNTVFKQLSELTDKLTCPWRLQIHF